MSQKQNNKVVSFRRPPNGGNIGVVIFAAIFIYIIICVFMYFTQKHIESYQVKMGSLSSNNVYKGIALRDEEIISATKSGYINYYAREGQRVGVGNLVYTIDESGKLADYLNTNGEGTTLTDKDLSELKTEILGFVNSFDHEEFASVYDFKNSVQGMVQKLSSANILDNIDKINSSGVSEHSNREYKIYEADEDAVYDEEYTIDLSTLRPTIAFPHLPENTKTIDEITGDVRIDQVVIGSCTNGRMDDMRTAAEILKGKHVADGVRCIIIPATQAIYLQCMEEGLLKIFVEAGAVVSTPTCGPCLGGYMGVLAAGERCVSTTNRNFVGRMGHVESEVYLASPAVAAASALTGMISCPCE